MKKKSTIIYTFLILAFFNCINLCQAQFSTLYNFTGVSDGRNPLNSLISDGTFLYGMTVYGGTIDSGTVFKIKPDGTNHSIVLNFGGATNGKCPNGSLYYDGTFLYGMTLQGGIHNKGTVFKIQPDGSGYSKLLDFSGFSNGSTPRGSLIFDGIFLYGMTSEGGTSNKGVIFKIKPDGTSYTKLLDFTGIANGNCPIGSLISIGSFLYGMTSGVNVSNGNIFKIKPDGTGFVQLMNFTGPNGGSPMGALITDGTFLYGMTSTGGAGSKGVIFKIKPDGTEYSKLLDFSGVANGSYPEGSLISVGSYLYGITQNGGANTDGGTLFKIKTDGTEYAKLHDFISGYYPQGSPFFNDNSIFGVTTWAGTGSCSSGCGTLFKYGVSTAGIAENSETNDLIVYPNPNNGIFTIAVTEKYNRLVITSILGEVVCQSEIKNLQSEIDLSKQSKGIYFVKMYDGKRIHTEKVIVQ